VDEIAAMGPGRIVVSPPGRPENAGVTLEAITRLGPRIPVLGVCLGHQAIGLAFGGRVVRAPTPMHGKTSTIRHDGRGIFRGVSNPFDAARYHSLIVERSSLPEELEEPPRPSRPRALAERSVMALRHRRYPTRCSFIPSRS
jgi:anthranilate synthase/aminodeoxychorismate synthase-like glutamine amidotransferase